MKVGFCFLLYDDLYHENVWKDYFMKFNSENSKNALNSNDAYGIYIYRKETETHPSQFVREHMISSGSIKTTWGCIYPAIRALYKEAYRDACHYFILLSDSTLPVKDIHATFSFIRTRERRDVSFISYIKPTDEFCMKNMSTETEKKQKMQKMRMTHEMMIQRYLGNMRRDLNFMGVDIGHWFFQETWSIMCKKHVKMLLCDTRHIRYFAKAFAYEENYPIYLLSLYGELPNVINIETTFVNWKEPEKKGVGKQSPKCYKKGEETHPSLSHIKNEVLFARKFDRDFSVKKFYACTASEK